MVQAGDGPCFALESLAQVRLVSQAVRQDLDGDGAIQAGQHSERN